MKYTPLSFEVNLRPEGFRGHRQPVVDNLCAPSFKWHLGGMPEIPNLQAFKQFVSVFLAGFRLFLHGFCAYGCRGQSGRDPLRLARHAPWDVQRHTPTGKQVTVTGITIDRVAGGKVVEE